MTSLRRFLKLVCVGFSLFFRVFFFAVSWNILCRFDRDTYLIGSFLTVYFWLSCLAIAPKVVALYRLEVKLFGEGKCQVGEGRSLVNLRRLDPKHTYLGLVQQYIDTE